MSDDGTTAETGGSRRALWSVTTIASVLTVGAVTSALWWAHPDPGRRDVAALPEVNSADKRQRLFIDFLRPVIRRHNERLRQRRHHLLRLLEALKAGQELGADQRAWLARMAEYYEVEAEKPLAQARALSSRIDIIPMNLALAQAALETAWGQSRFARKGNNLFGEWCFDPGCGIVPKERPEGRIYEVEAFEGVGASVRSYMHNLNTHPAYAELRRIRARARAAGKKPSGYALAAGLDEYAAIGDLYVKRVRSVIESIT